jgi:serine protease inhibitor
MKRIRRLTATAAVVATAGTLAAGCGARPAPNPGRARQLRGVAAIEPAVSARPFAAADLAFGLDLLGAWCRHDATGNIVLSPASLASGLGMAYLGARGATARAMAAVLHLPGSGSIEAGLHARSRALARLDGPGVMVAAADRVWADPELLPTRSYLNAVATGYGAGVGRVPMLTNPAAAARQIDAAIAAATKGHIAKLLTAQAVQGAIFVLTDALYLKAKWAEPFQPSQDTAGQFTTAAGQQVRAHYLNSGDVTSAAAGGWTAVSLPYQGGRLSMTALLPPAAPADAPAGRSAAAGCPGDLSPATLAVLDRRLSSAPAIASPISLPQVSVHTKANLAGLLSKLGMGVAFGGAADFSRMSPQAASLGAVEHAATLRVDAQGTVASAATAVVVLPSAVRATGPPIVFNRPYLLLVSATASGEPLFLARIADPAAR